MWKAILGVLSYLETGDRSLSLVFQPLRTCVKLADTFACDCFSLIESSNRIYPLSKHGVRIGDSMVQAMHACLDSLVKKFTTKLVLMSVQNGHMFHMTCNKTYKERYTLCHMNCCPHKYVKNHNVH